MHKAAIATDLDAGNRRSFLRTTLAAVTTVGIGGGSFSAMVEAASATPHPASPGAAGGTHGQGFSEFRAILPEEIDWKPFGAFPPAARLAVLVGQPDQPGPYAVRVKLPGGVKLMPHRHPEDRLYTVISGVFYIGRGEDFDPDKLVAYPPGSVVVLPGGTWHFHWAQSGEYVTQVTASGPLGLEYHNPADDPRGQHRS